jgi:hypothetical protein
VYLVLVVPVGVGLCSDEEWKADEMWKNGEFRLEPCEIGSSVAQNPWSIPTKMFREVYADGI